ncbi:hypothetical protein BDZ91DRAFT_760487 [Kalaharituber pfeilii]|nr:hypothetical protein BDZ91DRAFT_760487 [Kalaharituber pfeilii]
MSKRPPTQGSIPFAISRPKGLALSHETQTPNITYFNLQMSLYTGNRTVPYSSSSKLKAPSANSLEVAPQKRKRAKSDTPVSDRDRVDRDIKRGEKWSKEEEILLRERRNGEPESWEETGKYFVGRTTNALQKKWKLMMLADKMKIEPELENQLMNAVAKHAPEFYKKLAMEMNMSEDAIEIIEDKGKLPMKSGQSTSPTTQEDKTCSVSRGAHSTAASMSRHYSSDPYNDPAEKPQFHSALSYSSYRHPSSVNSSTFIPSSISDSEESVHYKYDDTTALEDVENSAITGIYNDRFCEQLRFSHNFPPNEKAYLADNNAFQEDFAMGRYCLLKDIDDSTMDGILAR